MLKEKAAALDDDMLQQLACAFMDRPRIWGQCKEVLKTHKYLRDVEPRVKGLARELSEIPSIGGAPDAEKSVNEIWRGAPVGDDVYVPPGYSISGGRPAIERIENRMLGDTPFEKRLTVSLAPVVITRRIGHVQSKSLLLEIAFKTNQGWRKLVQDRDVLLNSRKIVDTAKMGMPVRSGNALELTEWLGQYEHSNSDRIPIGYASSSMGWQGSDDNPTQHGFMCGMRQIGGNGRAIELEGSDGDIAQAKEIRPRGSFETWRDAVIRIMRFPAVRIALCGAIAPTLIAILEAPNCVAEWAGRTSTGKSTVLRVAQSCWRSASSHLATWNTTIIGIESAATFMSDLPLIVDDTSAAVEGGRSQSIGKIIYQLVSGRARGRATRDGGQRMRSKWRTFVMATGETPLGELARAEGAAARCLTFWSAPLGEATPETGALISDTMHVLGENYGHVGPMAVEWLCNNRDQWDTLRELYATTTKHTREKICTPAASRLAEVVALLECANWVGYASGCFPWAQGPLAGDPQIVQALRGAMSLASASADRAYDAFELALGEAQSKPKSWIPWGTNPGKDDRDPPGGWLGFRAAEEFAWFPGQLRKVLQGGGFTPEGAMRAWKDLGVLIKPERDRFTSQARPLPDRTKMRLIRVKIDYPGHEMREEED